MTNAEPDTATTGLINTIDELHTALDESSQSGTELGRYLLQHQQLTPAQLESALAIKSANPDRRLGEILVEQKALSAEALTMAISHLMGVPSVRLASLVLDRRVIHRLSPELARRHHVIPIMLHHEGLVVACASLPNNAALQELSFHAGTFIFPALASQEDIQAAIFLHYDTFAEDLAAADSMVRNAPDQDYQQLWRDAEYQAKQAPIVRLVGAFINEAIRRHASDVHLRPSADHFDIYYRIDGTLVCMK